MRANGINRMGDRLQTTKSRGLRRKLRTGVLLVVFALASDSARALQFGPLGGLGGMASGKVLQQFHLPSSPGDLVEFMLEYYLKQRMATTLPLNLDATAAYPTVENGALPGGPFAGRPLTQRGAALRTALPPGDYVVPVTAYCTQYSVHRAGEGTAYKLAPVQGTEGEAIVTLLWRGTLAGKRPQELQATNWAIQSGIKYGSMPKSYQALIDRFIPEYRDKLKGNTLDVVQDTYRDVSTDPRHFVQQYIKEKHNVTVPLMVMPRIAAPAPPLETVLARMGPSGRMLLDAKRQNDIFQNSYTSLERGEQVLFEGQGEQLPPEPASEGPWTVRVPGQAYLRFVVKGGNMHGDNLMQIRILPAAAPAASAAGEAGALQLKQVSYTLPAAVPEGGTPATAVPVPTSVYGLLGVTSAGDSPGTVTAAGVIGYSVGGGGAQALVPVLLPPTERPGACLRKLLYQPFVTNGRAGVCVYIGADSKVCSANATAFNWVQAYQTNVSRGKNADTGKDKCAENKPHTDLCTVPPTYPGDQLYRPGSEIDAFHTPQIGAWAQFGVDYLFRDEPNKPLNELAERAASIKRHKGTSDPKATWHTTMYNPAQDTGNDSQAAPNSQVVDNTEFVSLTDAGVDSPFTPLAKFSYGFTISADQQTITVDPLIIAGQEPQGGGQFSISALKKQPVPTACNGDPKLGPPPDVLNPEAVR